jgi:hypothetical protein
MDKKIKITILGVLISIALISTFVIAENSSWFCESNCGESYLGVCLDEDMCRINDYEIVTTIKWLEENNIKIYGKTGCGWCTKQLNEFGDFQDSIKELGLYIDCADSNNKAICSDIKATPTWKMNNKIINTGYLQLKDIEKSYN